MKMSATVDEPGSPMHLRWRFEMTVVIIFILVIYLATKTGRERVSKES